VATVVFASKTKKVWDCCRAAKFMRTAIFFSVPLPRNYYSFLTFASLMTQRFLKIFLPVLALCAMGNQSLQQPVRPDPKPRNIILMIGDGMGLTQITAGLYTSPSGGLFLEQFPITGLIRTHASDKLVTDSAAGATAFSCGCKTYNGAIGVFPNKKPCLTILETAARAGRATGLVASSSITHATPASFIAHVSNRAEMEEIATWFLKTPIDLLIGGGLKYFQQRADGQDLYKALKEKNYNTGQFAETALSAMNTDATRPFAWFSAQTEPVSVIDGRDYLPVAARMAPEFLKKRSGDKGFFMMLEGSQIDWACHSKDGERARREMLDFDAAIGEVLKFAKADGETLVIVTADHETGGMAIEQGSTRDSLDIDFATNYHTATMVPVFAFGPGAKAFGGIYDNTAIYQKMMAAW
jgi:alkaline phosphatase